MAPPTKIYHEVKDRPDCPLKLFTQFQCSAGPDDAYGEPTIQCKPFVRYFRQCGKSRIIEVTAIISEDQKSKVSQDPTEVPIQS